MKTADMILKNNFSLNGLVLLRDPKKLEIVGKDLHEYFFWKDELADFYGWQITDEMPKSPEEALEWCKEIWPEIFL